MDETRKREKECFWEENSCGCDELWVFGERISEGMQAEINRQKSDIMVRYCDTPMMHMKC